MCLVNIFDFQQGMISRPRADAMVKAKVTPSAAKAASKISNTNHPSKRPAKRDASGARNGHQNGHASNGDGVHPAPASTGKWAGLPDKIKELVRLAQEQGYLTYTDINDAL